MRSACQGGESGTNRDATMQPTMLAQQDPSPNYFHAALEAAEDAVEKLYDDISGLDGDGAALVGGACRPPPSPRRRRSCRSCGAARDSPRYATF